MNWWQIALAVIAFINLAMLALCVRAAFTLPRREPKWVGEGQVKPIVSHCCTVVDGRVVSWVEYLTFEEAAAELQQIERGSV